MLTGVCLLICMCDLMEATKVVQNRTSVKSGHKDIKHIKKHKGKTVIDLLEIGTEL